MVNGKAGVFPSNFVEMLNNTDAAAAKNKMMTVGNAAPLSEPQKASRVETKNKRNENLKENRTSGVTNNRPGSGHGGLVTSKISSLIQEAEAKSGFIGGIGSGSGKRKSSAGGGGVA